MQDMPRYARYARYAKICQVCILYVNAILSFSQDACIVSRLIAILVYFYGQGHCVSRWVWPVGLVCDNKPMRTVLGWRKWGNQYASHSDKKISNNKRLSYFWFSPTDIKLPTPCTSHCTLDVRGLLSECCYNCGFITNNYYIDRPNIWLYNLQRVIGQVVVSFVLNEPCDKPQIVSDHAAADAVAVADAAANVKQCISLRKRLQPIFVANMWRHKGLYNFGTVETNCARFYKSQVQPRLIFC